MKIKKNGKVIKLTESDLKRIVKKVLITENMSDPEILFSDTETNVDVGNKGGKRNVYQLENPEDVITGNVTARSSTKGNKERLVVYKIDLKSPIQGCGVEIVPQGMEGEIGNHFGSIDVIRPYISGSGSAYNINFKLTEACKRGIYNEQSKTGGEVVKLGTLKAETNGTEDIEANVRFVGKMRSTGSKTDI